MDTFFLSHGNPSMLVDDSIQAGHFFKSWQKNILTRLKQRPTSILVISGHWETTVPTVNTIHDQHSVIYDFDEPSEDLYKMTYPAPGAPSLALRVKELLTQSGYPVIEDDKFRGLDHGAWIPLKLMYPEADIPVCQLSVQTEMDGTYHFNLGKALAPLRDEGVLIMGSGAATHNLSLLGPNEDPVPSWAFEFDKWLKECLLNGRYEDVNHYDEKAPQPKMNHPTPDHFYPLHVALGAAGGETAKAQLIHHSWGEACLCYASYRFSPSTESIDNVSK